MISSAKCPVDETHFHFFLVKMNYFSFICGYLRR
jgi:hypothetical protein